MKQVKITNPLGLVCRCIPILWVSALTFIVFHTMTISTGFSEKMTRIEESQSVLIFETQFMGLSEQIYTAQTELQMQQTQLERIEQELQHKFSGVNAELPKYVQWNELSILTEQFKTLEDAVQKLQATQTPPSPSQAVSPPVNSPVKPATTSRANTVPPFIILCVEVLGGESLLAVMPTGKNAITSIQFMRSGQRIGNWKLQSIDGRHATFETGGRNRQLPIPQ